MLLLKPLADVGVFFEELFVLIWVNPYRARGAGLGVYLLGERG